MKKAIVATGAAAVGFAAALAVGPPSSAAADPHPKHLTVVAQDSEATLTPSAFFSAPVQNAQASEDAPVYRKGTKVGLAETVYTWTRGTGDDPIIMLECSVELPEGRILFAGTFHGADMATGADVPVVGGIGGYAGVSGVVHMVPSADGASTTLTFDLTR